MRCSQREWTGSVTGLVDQLCQRRLPHVGPPEQWSLDECQETQEEGGLSPCAMIASALFPAKKPAGGYPNRPDISWRSLHCGLLSVSEEPSWLEEL